MAEQITAFQQRTPIYKRHLAKPVPGSAKPGYSSIYRNACLDRDTLYDSISPELDTLTKLFSNAADTFPDDDCIGVRRFHNVCKNQFDPFYTYQSYKAIRERKNKIAAGIVYYVTGHANYKKETYINDKPNFCVSLLSPNRIEWLLVDLATRDISLPNTALYPTLGRQSSQYILEVTSSPILFLTKNQISRILDLKEDKKLPDLNVLVSLDDFTHDDKILFERADAVGIELIDFRAVEKTGERYPLPGGEDYNPPTPDSIYTYSFTSGTTGNPKGVVLTHRIAVSGVLSCMECLDKPVSLLNMEKFLDFKNNRDDGGQQLTTVCVLPLAHIYERQITNFALSVGYRTGMLSDPSDPRSMFSDIIASRPHYLCSVPRVWNKLEAAIKDVLAKKFKLTGSIEESGAHEVDKMMIRNYLRHQFGYDNCKYVVSGSAPIGGETIKFLKDALCVGFMSAYGSTESFAGICFGDPFREKKWAICCGAASVTCEVRLRDLSNMGYSVEDKPYIRGELMLRGPQIFSEYLKNPKATKESFDEDGFFHTGDVAAIDSEGELYIIDRVKNFFKLAQGEYVTPEKIENVYLAHCPLLTQIFVHGDSLKNYLVGIAGVSAEYVSQMLKQDHGVDIAPSDVCALLKDPKFKKLVITEMNRHVADADLQGFEKLHNVHFDLEPLKIEDEVLTPTLKLKRENARKKFADVLQKLYDEGSMVKTNKL